MVVYSCHCLNIQLFAEPPSHHLHPENLASCPLGSDIELVELVDQGFQCSQKCLVHRSNAGPWTVYVCVLCKRPTHAVDQDANIVAVSTSMTKGKSAIENMRQRPDFSPAFGLLLNQSEERSASDTEGQSYDSMQKQLMELQAVLSGFLRLEEDAMERRIRKFEEEQRAKFESLREKCVNEKTILSGLLFNSLEDHNSNSVSPKQPPPQPQPQPQPTFVEQNSSPVNMRRSHAPLGQTKSAGVADMISEKRHSRPLSGSSSRKSRDSRDLSPDDVFAMDDFDIALDVENDNSPASPRLTNSPRQSRGSASSYTSLDHRLRQEDRNNSNHFSHQTTTTNTTANRRSRGRDITSAVPLVEGSANPAASRNVLSSSLPISMPVLPRNLRDSSNLDDDIDEESTDFDDIPRHMQALSESIQERDRYIFGDRPRPRVNTGDFTQINWR